MPGSKEMDLTTAWKIVSKKESHDAWKVKRATAIAMEAILANMKESIVPDIAVKFVGDQWVGVDEFGERPLLEVLNDLKKNHKVEVAKLTLRVLKG